MAETHGRKIVESAAMFQPVTLAPGESTELEIQREYPTVKIQSFGTPLRKPSELEIEEAVFQTAKEDAVIRDYVSFSVTTELAAHNGWWSGKLLVPISEEEKGPNPPPRTPVSGTPAAASSAEAAEAGGAPVAPTLSAAGR